MSQAIILFAHGARDPAWADPVKRLQQILGAKIDQVGVHCAYLEHMQPDLATTVHRLMAQQIQRITLVPVFLAQGGHLKQDLPKQIAALQVQYPEMKLQVMPPLGESEVVLNAISDWIVQSTAR
jgi:sirohydrochlorin cobaltochelatase